MLSLKQKQSKIIPELGSCFVTHHEVRFLPHAAAVCHFLGLPFRSQVLGVACTSIAS